MNPPDVTFRAASIADLESKIAAYEVLFDVVPWVGVEGTVTASDGDPAWLSKPHQIVAVGRKFVTVNLGVEGAFRMDVERNANVARYALRAR